MAKQRQYQKSQMGAGFQPVEPVKFAPGLASTSSQAITDYRAVQQADYSNYQSYTEEMAKRGGETLKGLAAFSETLATTLDETQKVLKENKEMNAAYSSMFSGPDVERDEKDEEVDAAAKSVAQTNAQTANLMYGQTNNPGLSNMAYYMDGGGAQNYMQVEGDLLGAQAGYNGFMATFLESGGYITVNGQKVRISDAANSGDYALTSAAFAAGRRAFYRQYGLSKFSKKQLVDGLKQTIVASDSTNIQARVAKGILTQQENMKDDIAGRAYASGTTATSESIGAIWQRTAEQFYTRPTGLSRAEANEEAVDALIKPLEDAGNTDAIRALLDVEAVPGNAGTKLRYKYGDKINDAITRAEGNRVTRDNTVARDLERAMYGKLARASNAQERDQIVQQTVTALGNAGLHEKARQLELQQTELRTDSGRDANARRLQDQLASGEANAETVRQAVINGSITQQQADTLLSAAGKTSGDVELTKNLSLKGALKGQQDRFAADFLTKVGLQADSLGNYSKLNSNSIISEGTAKILVANAKVELQRVAATTLNQLPEGASESAKITAINTAMQEWYAREFLNEGGKYYTGKEANEVGQYDTSQQQRLNNLANSPVMLSATSTRGVTTVQPQDFSSKRNPTGVAYKFGDDVPRHLASNFRGLRGDKIFTQDQTETLLEAVKKGKIPKGLQKAADGLGLTPRALLNQQAYAYDLEPLPAASTSGSAAQMNPRSLQEGYQTFMNLGFPSRGAAYLAGSIQQESGWNGNRTWDDVGAPAGGIVSWRAGRLNRLIEAVGPIDRASQGAQLDYMLKEMRASYPEAYRIFMNPYATDRDLQRATKIYWGYGEAGARYRYAQSLLK